MNRKVMSKSEVINLWDLGSLTQLRMGVWTGRKLLSREDLQKCDMNPDKLPDDITSVGSKLLVPRNEINKIQTIGMGLRAWLYKNSLPFSLAHCQFIPKDLMSETLSRLEQGQKEFNEAVDSFIAKFDTIKEQMKQNHPEFFEKCLKDFYPANPKALRSRFYLGYSVFKIAGVGSAEEEKKFRLKQEVTNFVSESVGLLRQQTKEFCELVEARVNGKVFGDETEPKKFTKKSITSFRKYIERFKNLNIFGDEKVEEMLDEFKKNFLDDQTPEVLSQPGMIAAINKHLHQIKELAMSENSQDFIAEVSRKIEI